MTLGEIIKDTDKDSVKKAISTLFEYMKEVAYCTDIVYNDSAITYDITRQISHVDRNKRGGLAP